MGLFKKTVLFSLFFSAAAFAQLPFSVGVKAGVPLTDAFQSTTTPGGVRTFTDSKNYIVGPMVELRLPFHLAVEADGLYRPLNVTTTVGPSNAVTARFGGDYSSWEFPILAKYRFSSGLLQPYVEAGPSFRTLSSGVDHLSNSGFTVGVGSDVKALLIRVSPEFRYTRWAGDSTAVTDLGRGISKLDQVEFLVGFSF